MGYGPSGKKETTTFYRLRIKDTALTIMGNEGVCARVCEKGKEIGGMAIWLGEQRTREFSNINTEHTLDHQSPVT